MSSRPAPHPQQRAAFGRRLLAEGLGTSLLVAVVVGSGIAARRLSPGDAGLQLLENSLVTALGLTVLILTFGPVSGAHLNPVVSVVDWLVGRRAGTGLTLPQTLAYVAAQAAGAISGALLANAMFSVPTQVSLTIRDGTGLLLGETVATAGLVVVIFGLARTGRPNVTAPAVGAYIGAAYWFTSSTSFANPAVTVGRMFSDTFAGIAPASVPAFLAAQLVGGAVALGVVSLLFPDVSRAAGDVVIPPAPAGEN
ncbi:MAG: aquaporin family protein [Micrococcales bacterium]|nr:aquaporin family protein [Micrococcales bacterium]